MAGSVIVAIKRNKGAKNQAAIQGRRFFAKIGEIVDSAALLISRWLINIAWTTLRVAHTAHSLDDEVGTFSAVKWVLFQLSRCRQNGPSGSVFDCQMGTFSLDKSAPGSCVVQWKLARKEANTDENPTYAPT